MTAERLRELRTHFTEANPLGPRPTPSEVLTVFTFASRWRALMDTVLHETRTFDAEDGCTFRIERTH